MKAVPPGGRAVSAELTPPIAELAPPLAEALWWKLPSVRACLGAGGIPSSGGRAVSAGEADAALWCKASPGGRAVLVGVAVEGPPSGVVLVPVEE